KAPVPSLSACAPEAIRPGLQGILPTQAIREKGVERGRGEILMRQTSSWGTAMRRKFIRPIALFMIVGVIAAGCSKPKKTGLGSGGGTNTTLPDVAAPVAAADTSTTAAVAAAAKKQAAKTARTAVTGLSGGGLDDAQARAVGALLKPQSTQRRKPYAS